jgi:hypothetical protein
VTVALHERTGVHQLQHDSPAGGVDGFRHAAPPLDLLGRDDRRLVGVGLRVEVVCVGPLRDDQAEAPRGELGVVARHRLGRDAVAGGAHA